MCRNIKTFFNFDPPATDAEIRASAVQFVRKLSGFTQPSRVNHDVFDHAVEDVTVIARRLIDGLDTKQPARNREAEIAKRKAKAALQFA